MRKKIGKGRHHSALKRERQNERRRARNRMVLSALRTEIKKVKTTRSKDVLVKAISQIDKAVTKGVIPRKRASRIISRLTTVVTNTTQA